MADIHFNPKVAEVAAVHVEKADNAAMIACAGYYRFIKYGADDLTLDAFADLPF